MKKTLNIMLSLLIIVSFSLNVSSQSDQKDLDQVKLLKQFIGSWEADIAPDTVTTIEFIQAGAGIYSIQETKAKGKTYETSVGIMGFSDDKKSIITSDLWHIGIISQDIGKFISDQKLVLERFPNDQKHARVYIEIEFLSPESFIWRAKFRDNGMTWGEVWDITATVNKVKE